MKKKVLTTESYGGTNVGRDQQMGKLPTEGGPHVAAGLGFLNMDVNVKFCGLFFALQGKEAGGCPKKEVLPHATQEADMYQQDVGSSLTRISCFGTDPFSTEDNKMSPEQRFADDYPDISV